MADATRELLQQFAHDTGHRAYELEDPKHVALVARKFLATQAPLVDWRCVYPHVSNDLERLTFRSKEGGSPALWNTDKVVPLEVYRYLIPDNVKCAAQVHFARETGEEDPLLFFMHGARNKNLRSLLEELHTDWDERRVEDLYQRVRGYEVDPQEDLAEVARDIGVAIAELELPQIEVLGEVYIPIPREPIGEQETHHQEEGEKEIVLAPSVHLGGRVSEKHEERLRENPVLMAYKSSACLFSAFPTEKAIKQMLVAMVAPGAVRLAEPVMGKRQRKLGNVDLTHVDPADWQHLLDVATQNIGEHVTQLGVIRDFYHALSKGMPRVELEQMTRADLVQHLLTVYSAPEEYERLWPVTPTMKRCIGKFLIDHPTLGEDVVQQLIL